MTHAGRSARAALAIDRRDVDVPSSERWSSTPTRRSSQRCGARTKPPSWYSSTSTALRCTGSSQALSARRPPRTTCSRTPGSPSFAASIGSRGDRRSRPWLYRIAANIAKTRAVRDGRTVPFSALGSDDGEPSVDPDRFLGADHPSWPGHWASRARRLGRPARGPTALGGDASRDRGRNRDVAGASANRDHAP